MSDPKERAVPDGDEEIADAPQVDKDEDADEGQEDAVEGGEGDDEGAEEAESVHGEGAEADGETRPDVTERRPASHENNRVRSLNRRLREAERERDELRARQGERGPSQADLDRMRQDRERAEAAEIEQARLSGNPEDVSRTITRQSERRIAEQLAYDRNQRVEDRDRDRFDALCDRKPHFARISDEVEREVQAARQRGNYSLSRENIAYWLIGKRADEQASRARNKAQARGEAAVGRQRVAPGRGAQSDVTAQRRRGGDDIAAIERRLRNVSI